MTMMMRMMKMRMVMMMMVVVGAKLHPALKAHPKTYEVRTRTARVWIVYLLLNFRSEQEMTNSSKP